MARRSTLYLRSAFLFALAWAWVFLPQGPVASPPPELNWYKGNLHTHTVHSDGDSAPANVARWYKEHHYQFLVLTDHNYFTDPAGLNSVIAADERFLLISGEEVTSAYKNKSVHVNAFRLRKTIPPAFGDSLIDTIQKNVDVIRQAGSVPSLNHPNFRWSITPEELRQINNLKLFEVYNGHPTVHNFGGGGVVSLEQMWDVVLSAGRQVYGIAVDDAHYFKEFRPDLSNPGRGWVSVQAPELSESAIVSAIEAGRFYASTGVELEKLNSTTGGLDIVIKQQGDFKYTTRYTGQGGKLLATSQDLASSYKFRPGETYVRATVTRSDNEFAWVQPVFAR